MKENMRFWLGFVGLTVASLSMGMLLGNCIAPNPRTGTVDGNEFQVGIDMAAVQAKVDQLESAITGFATGDIAVGGEGDNLTTWILAIGIVICTPAGGLFYQFVLRPIALPRRERNHRLKTGATQETGAAPESGATQRQE